MTEFIWKESFSIGIDEIDKQHQELLKMLNRCIKESEKGKEKSKLAGDDFNAINEIINELSAYTDTHFKTEEQLMHSVNYPELKQQQDKHRMLTGQVIQLKENVSNKEMSAVNSITALLRDWFIEHIMDEDKRIGAYIRSRKE